MHHWLRRPPQEGWPWPGRTAEPNRTHAGSGVRPISIHCDTSCVLFQLFYITFPRCETFCSSLCGRHAMCADMFKTEPMTLCSHLGILRLQARQHVAGRLRPVLCTLGAVCTRQTHVRIYRGRRSPAQAWMCMHAGKSDDTGHVVSMHVDLPPFGRCCMHVKGRAALFAGCSCRPASYIPPAS